MALPFHLPERERERVLFILDATVFNIIAHTGGQTIICAREGGGGSCSNKQSQSGPGSSIRVAALGRKAGGWPPWRGKGMQGRREARRAGIRIYMQPRAR